MAALDFWYEFGSTYSYPAAMRIERLADAAHVELRWRPFLLGPIFKAYGWNDSPFNIYAAKGRYMWRDLQRICEAEKLPPKLPPVRFPQIGVDAEAALVAANGAETKEALKVQTSEAGSRGLFACPLSPSATNCSGATTGSRRGSPGRHVRRTTCCATMPHRLICVDIDHVEAHLSTSIASREKPND